VVVFKDINPQAPTHWLVVPKTRQGLTQLREARAEHASILGHMMTTIAKVALSCPPHSMPLLFEGRVCVCQAVEAVWAVCVAGGPPPLACSLSRSLALSLRLSFRQPLCVWCALKQSLSHACALMWRTVASRDIETGT